MVGIIRIESAKPVETGRARIGRARCKSGFSSANFCILRRIQRSAVAINAMKRAWIKNVKGSRSAKVADAFSCEEIDSPPCFSHSVRRLVSRLQMGGLSLTKTFFNASFCACSIKDSAVRTRACSEAILACNVKTRAWPDSAACRVRAIELTTLWTLCKKGPGVLGCCADWSVACQVALN